MSRALYSIVRDGSRLWLTGLKAPANQSLLTECAQVYYRKDCWQSALGTVLRGGGGGVISLIVFLAGYKRMAKKNVAMFVSATGKSHAYSFCHVSQLFFRESILGSSSLPTTTKMLQL